MESTRTQLSSVPMNANDSRYTDMETNGRANVTSGNTGIEELLNAFLGRIDAQSLKAMRLKVQEELAAAEDSEDWEEEDEEWEEEGADAEEPGEPDLRVHPDDDYEEGDDGEDEDCEEDENEDREEERMKIEKTRMNMRRMNMRRMKMRRMKMMKMRRMRMKMRRIRMQRAGAPRLFPRVSRCGSATC